MSKFRTIGRALAVMCTATAIASPPAFAQREQKPNIVRIGRLRLWRRGYSGPVTLSQYERFENVREALEKAGVMLPVATGN
jgi:hypothetical protein